MRTHQNTRPVDSLRLNSVSESRVLSNPASSHSVPDGRVRDLDNVNESGDSAGISICLFPVRAPPTNPAPAPTRAPIPAPFPPPANPPIRAPPAAPPPVVAAVLLPLPLTVLSKVPVWMG